jgi:hypothetical protein
MQEKDKPERVPGPPPLPHLNADSFQVDEEFTGFQLSLQLHNMCGFQDKISAVVFTGNYISASEKSRMTQRFAQSPIAPDGTLLDSAVAAHATSPVQPPAAGLPTAPNSVTDSKGGSFEWKLRTHTEVQTVLDRPHYGRTTLESVQLYFALLQDPFPIEDDFVTIQVYKHEAFAANDTNNQVVNNSNLTKLCSCVFPRSAVEANTDAKGNTTAGSVYKVDMKVTNSHSVDISNPVEEAAAAVLGLVRLSSAKLQYTRSWLANTLDGTPYSEVAYSFGTQSGQTLSVEQLFVSKYPMQVASAFTRLLLAERRPMVESLLSILESEEEKLALERMNYAAHAHTNGAGNSSNMIDEGDHPAMQYALQHEAVLSALELADELHDDVLEMYTKSCDFTTGIINSTVTVNSTVIGEQVGGQCLRRSVWKKVPNWQFCTVNLNLHIMSSVHFSYDELLGNPVKRSRDVSGSNTATVIPTLTLGCPAAHALKYHDGGLKRIFGHLTST